MPIYFILGLIYVITEFVGSPGGALLQTVLLFPAELLGIQSVFDSLFTFFYNGGTRFITCIMLCYIICPAIQELIIRIRAKIPIIILLILTFVLLYATFVIWYFELSSIYKSLFFRLIELYVGVVIASMKNVLDKTEFIKKYFYDWFFVFDIGILMISGVTVAVNLQVPIGNNVLSSRICLTCFVIFIIALSGISFGKMENRCKKMLLYLSELTYCLFLTRLFSNHLSKVIIYLLNINDNLMIIFIGWNVCILITVFLYKGIERRLKQYFANLLLE